MTRPVPPTHPRGRKSKSTISREPSNDTQQALVQLKRTFGSVWAESAENPSVKLIACESNVGARVNSYHAGRWVSRRVSEDTLVALVELQDGTQAQMKFQRGVLDGVWKRVAS